MGKSQRTKGAAGEREAAKKLCELFPGCEAQRSARNGVGDAEDLHHKIIGTHFEVKRCEALSLYKAMEQAEEAAPKKTQVVLHKRNRKPWLAIVKLEDLPQLVANLERFVE